MPVPINWQGKLSALSPSGRTQFFTRQANSANSIIDRRFIRRNHQVERLYWPVRHCAGRCQSVDCVLAKPAIGVNDDYDLGWICAEMLKAPVQRISLADFFGIMALDDLGARCCGDSGGIVGAIVRDDEQPIAWTQLRLDVFDRGQKSCAFVVCWHENGKPACEYSLPWTKRWSPAVAVRSLQ